MPFSSLFFFAFSAELTQQEIHGVSFILRRLSSTTFRSVATVHLSHHLDHLDSSLLELFMQSLVQLTCLCAHRAVQEEEVCVCACVCVCVCVCMRGVCEGTPLVKNSMFFSFFLLPPPPFLPPPSLSSPSPLLPSPPSTLHSV